jgi:serine O-acetyltransferase
MTSLSIHSNHSRSDSSADRTSSGNQSGIDDVIDSVVQDLREIRSRNKGHRARHGRPAQLPSRKSLTSVVEGLSTALFPNRLAGREFSANGVDYFVGHTLQAALGELVDQIQRELYYESEQQVSPESHRSDATEIVRRFAEGLPQIRRLLEEDLQAAYEGDPAAGSVDVVLACYPGITAVIHHRLAHALHRVGAPLVARIISEISHSITGIDIHPGASIQGSFFIDHGTGVVIGETAVIGERVRLYQAVTLGARRFPIDENGVLIKGTARHPIVEDDVVIYAGATVLGRITIGKGSVIGGNVWLTRSVPPGSNISQAKLRSEDFDGGSGI